MAISPGDKKKGEYFFLAKDPEGTYISKAETILRERGIHEYTHTVRPGKGAPTAAERVLLMELQNLLPPNVHLPKENPFLTLHVQEDGEEPGLARCKCECGGSFSCGGGGGGGK